LENQFTPLQPYNNKALKSLCALSYFWTSLSILFLIGVFVFAFLLIGDSDKFIYELRNALNGGQYEIDQDLKSITITYFADFITLIITFIGVVMMHKKNEIGLIVYAIGELAIYMFLFFNDGVSRLALSLQGGGGPYSGIALVYGGLALLLISDIIFIYLYYRALEKAKGNLFLNFLN
jgi:hypothetical protein